MDIKKRWLKLLWGFLLPATLCAQPPSLSREEVLNSTAQDLTNKVLKFVNRVECPLVNYSCEYLPGGVFAVQVEETDEKGRKTKVTKFMNMTCTLAVTKSFKEDRVIIPANSEFTVVAARERFIGGPQPYSAQIVIAPTIASQKTVTNGVVEEIIPPDTIIPKDSKYQITCLAGQQARVKDYFNAFIHAIELAPPPGQAYQQEGKPRPIGDFGHPDSKI